MSYISFSVHICGMTCKDLSDKVMIDTPIRSVDLFYNLGYADTPNESDEISKLIEYIKTKEHDILDCLDGSCLERLCIDNLYIEYEGYYFGFRKDLKLEELFKLINTDHLKFHYFYVAGGASRSYSEYLFIVHPDEHVHRYDEPHVHVKKDNISPRYSLKTFKMFEGDKYTHEHLRDKKKIEKYLKKNRKWFMKKWESYMGGLVPPTETIEWE